MFEQKKIMFIYCVSPLHMGAGTALGMIDNPIQRERHTQHPMIVGSGIKGALRHHFASLNDISADIIDKVFGPETSGAEHAGAASFSDAQIVLFPVRSLRNSYVYATCPTALARLKRLLDIAGNNDSKNWDIPANLSDDNCLILNDTLKVQNNIILESYQFIPENNAIDKQNFQKIAAWISENALPDNNGLKYFKNKIALDMVLLSDNRFNYFVRNATVVEPHVRISDDTGTAEEGGLFYTENLPPESLLVSLLMTSVERRKKGDDTAEIMQANNILEIAVTKLDSQMVQMGGDATTGRGQVVVKFA